MREPRNKVSGESALATAKQSAIDLHALSRETSVPVDVLRTFAAVSDPTNERLFTAESARKAFVIGDEP